MKKNVFIIITTLFFMGNVWGAISIDPMRIELSGQPGKKLSGFYTITNTKEYPVMVQIASKDYFVLDENSQYAIDDWIKLSSKKFRIEANGYKEIKYTIRVPKKAVGFLMVLNSFTASKISEKGAVETEMLNMVYSVPIYVRIEGTEKIEASIKTCDIAGDSRYINTTVTVHNSGNTYLRISGAVDIRDADGKSVGIINLKEGWPVFPSQNEQYRGRADGLTMIPGKTYTAAIQLKSENPLFTLEEKKVVFEIDKKGIVMKK